MGAAVRAAATASGSRRVHVRERGTRVEADLPPHSRQQAGHGVGPAIPDDAAHLPPKQAGHPGLLDAWGLGRPLRGEARLDLAPARLTLHAKCVVIDRSRALAGSLNLDPNSIEFNTEMGIFVDSATFAGPSTTPSRRTCPATPRPCGSTPNAACSGKPARDTTRRSGAAIPAPRSAGGSFRVWCPPCPSSKTSSAATGRFRSQLRLKIR